MTTPAPDGFRPEWLAAYADGELDAATRAIVERWLAVHPAGRADLNAQRELSPANAPFWEKVEPPEPAAADWTAVFRRMTGELAAAAPDRPWRGRAAVWALAGLATAGVAAAVAWVAFAPPAPPPRGEAPRPVEVVQQTGPEVAPMPRPLARPGASDDPVAGVAILPMAGDDDVVLDRVPDLRAGWLPAGEHPLAGVMALVGEEELELAGLAGGPKVTTAPGDAPMIYAAKLR